LSQTARKRAGGLELVGLEAIAGEMDAVRCGLLAQAPAPGTTQTNEPNT
jgi:hypothetical protein